MNKVVYGLILGGILGAFDGLTAWFTPEVRPQLMGIVFGSTIKGIIAGILIGYFARKVNSLPLGILFGLGVGLLLAFFIALSEGKYYFEIMLPGGLVGLIVGYATQKYGSAGSAPVARAWLKRHLNPVLKLKIERSSAMSRVIHFEIPADNPERAVEFYKKVFGWNFQKWAGPTDYWLVSTGPDSQPGINGGLLQRQYPGAGTCNTVDVASLDQSVASIIQHGGKNVVPKMAIPGVGHLAYCSDTEGNVFGLMQADKNAK